MAFGWLFFSSFWNSKVILCVVSIRSQRHFSAFSASLLSCGVGEGGKISDLLPNADCSCIGLVSFFLFPLLLEWLCSFGHLTRYLPLNWLDETNWVCLPESSPLLTPIFSLFSSGGLVLGADAVAFATTSDFDCSTVTRAQSELFPVVCEVERPAAIRLERLKFPHPTPLSPPPLSPVSPDVPQRDAGATPSYDSFEGSSKQPQVSDPTTYVSVWPHSIPIS